MLPVFATPLILLEDCLYAAAPMFTMLTLAGGPPHATTTRTTLFATPCARVPDAGASDMVLYMMAAGAHNSREVRGQYCYAEAFLAFHDDVVQLISSGAAAERSNRACCVSLMENSRVCSKHISSMI
ncbi:hypothetical protein OBBRIDRAFT_418055 [Obba rivulosa]|uniref:Uncharacterized protein n=1 Tax=Obba rivulosa TaxID=1052685 RepID=A0A8E2DMF1_9APHY|nr:hypothetical protein OBBRIDRAFT_418055 [Obba rivulosa]